VKAAVAAGYGSPDVIRLKEIPTPTPKDKQIRIRIHASTVTAGDCEIRRFDMPTLFWLPVRLLVGITKPRVGIFGQELSGEVESVGKDVTRFKKGDEVFGPTELSFGAHADYICLPESYAIARKPTNMSHEEAAGVSVGGLNALYFMRRVNVQRGEEVLINGAGGSIGTFAVQMAKSREAVVTAVDSTKKLPMLRSIGADHVIDYTREDFTKRADAYDVIFDIAGKSSFSGSLKALKRKGRFALANFTVSEVVRGRWASITGEKNVIQGLAPYRSEDLVHLKDLIEAGQLKAIIDKRYPLEQVDEAHRYVETGVKTGNVVITVISNGKA
jgi:NADPH:quinone reductase-like Zn-dependent oxidoreductase